MSNKEFFINIILTIFVSTLFIIFRTWDLQVITKVAWIFFTISNMGKIISFFKFDNQENPNIIKKKAN